MTIASALMFGPASIARASWPHQRVDLEDGKLLFARFRNSVIRTEWKPKPEDLVAEDWISFDEVPLV